MQVGWYVAATRAIPLQTPWSSAVLLPLLLIACSSAPDAPDAATPAVDDGSPVTITRPGAPVQARQTGAFAFARQAASGRFEVAPATRPGDAPLVFSPTGKAVEVKGDKDKVIWAFPLPANSFLFPDPQAGANSFGNHAPAGLKVTWKGEPLTFVRRAERARSYGYDRERLLIALPAAAPAPRADDIQLRWPKAQAAERSLHFAHAGLSPEAFVARELTVGEVSRTGLLLPAPTTATWSLTVPEGGVLGTRASVLEPFIRDLPASDGVGLRVEVDAGDGWQVLHQAVVRLGSEDAVRLDLAAYAGQSVRIRLSSTVHGEPTGDLLFLHEPTVYTSSERPRRVVMIYLDTLRADHLGAYGYDRATSPKLDAWAEDAMRLDNHRTVAPWTLPSARAAFSGAQPEFWEGAPTLASRLAQAGFLSDGIVGNAFLTPTFLMDQGFSQYTYKHLLPAKKVVDHGLKVLEEHPDRDLLLYLQFMDAHLPYMEPKRYRGRWEGDKPEGLRSVALRELRQIKPGDPDLPAVSAYVQGRYDQNIAYIDDQLARLWKALPDDATVVVFSDHGEEFWDHGGFEHGHDFHDELLRVPTFIRSPGMPAGSTRLPTNLLDLTPTVLQLEGLDHDVRDGLPLMPALTGDASAQDALLGRSQAFGRPLYGEDGWGVVAEARKWWTRGVDQWLYDLTTDPGELDPLLAPKVAGDEKATRDWGTEKLADGLGVPAAAVWRLTLPPARAARPTRLQLTLAEPIEAAWLPYDPQQRHKAVEVQVTDGRLEMTVPAGVTVPPAVFVQPAAMSGGLKGGHLQLDGHWTQDLQLSGGRRWRHDKPRMTLEPTTAVPPFGQAVGAFHEDLAEQLKELGYAE